MYVKCVQNIKCSQIQDTSITWEFKEIFHKVQHYGTNKFLARLNNNYKYFFMHSMPVSNAHYLKIRTLEI